MKYFVDGLLMNLNESDVGIRSHLASYFGISENAFRYVLVKRRTVLSNNKPMGKYSFIVDTYEFVRNTSLHFFEGFQSVTLPRYKEKGEPVVIGSGFTGLFTAYLLAKAGAKPVVIEQGENSAERKRTIDFFESRNQLNESSNYRNGQGGSFASLGGYIEQLENQSFNEFLLPIFRDLGLSDYPEKEGFRFVTPEKASSAMEKMISFVFQSGGNVLFDAKFLAIERFLGWPRNVVYSEHGIKKSIKASSVIFASGTSESSLMGLGCNRGVLEPCSPVLGFFLEISGRDFENEYYGRGKTGTGPPLFSKDAFHLKGGKKGYLDFIYPNSELVNGTIKPNMVDLRVRQGAWSGSGNAIAVIRLPLTPKEAEELSLDSSCGFGEKLLSSAFKKDKPFAAPAEALGDYLNKKEPLMLRDVRPSYKKGIYLANFHRLLPPFLTEMLTETLYAAGRKYPLLSRSGAILAGFSTLGTSRYLPQGIATGGRGVWNALPKTEDGRNLLASAYRALETVLAFLNAG